MENFFFLFLFCFFSVLLLPFAYSISFQIPRFDPNDARILYEGDARPNVGAIDFTSLTYFCHIGRATYAQKVPLWDPKSNKLTDFTTRFSFTIDTQNRSSYAAGLAFFLAPAEFTIPVNSIGGFLGLYNTTTSDSSTNQIVHVEFDTFSNPEWDPPYQHAGINKDSIASAITAAWNASFHSDDDADVLITYNSTTKNFSVSWTYDSTNNPRENSSLSLIIDLREVLPEWIKIGFSAATSNLMERNLVSSWEFSSSLDIKEAHEKEDGNLGLAVGLPVSIGVLIVGAIAVFGIWWRRKKQQEETTAETMNLTSINEDLERGAGPRRFSYKELMSATNSFSNDRKLGAGGFGAVYKGYLNDLHIYVAVKKISRGSKQGKKEYITEIRIISRLRHRNLVQLLGWCHDRGEFLIVYEFMSNGSLDSHLFGNKTPLTWVLRYKIALGIASGLLYLHEEWEQCVVHRDIKSSNIMLDSSFNVKLGDFGLAKLMDHELGPLTTGLAGTFGYLAPEYISTGRASKESDVYSFGVVALEIATGRKAVNPTDHSSEMSLLEWIWSLYGSGNLTSAADPRLRIDFDREQVECLMIVGLWCAHPDHKMRPSIRHAIQVLNFEAAMPNLPTTMPVPRFHAPASSSSGEPTVSSSILETGR